MSILSTNLSGFGLDITDKNIKLVQAVKRQQDRYRLQAWGQEKLKPGWIDHGTIVDKEKVLMAAKKLRANLKGKLTSELAVVSLPEAKTFLKLFELVKPESGEDNKKKRQKSEDKLEAAIEKELPKEIPVPIDNIIYDYHIVRESKTSWTVLVGVAPRDIALEYTELIKAMGFKPLAFEIEAQPITRALLPERAFAKSNRLVSRDFKLPKFSLGRKKPVSEGNQAVPQVVKKPVSHRRPPVFIADLGATRSSLIIFDEHSIRFTRELELSGDRLTELIAGQLGLTPGKAEQAKIVCGLDERKCKGQVSPIMAKWASDLAQELSATLDYYRSQVGSELTGIEVFLCGGSASLIGLPELLTEYTGVRVRVANPLNKFIPNKRKLLPIPDKLLLGYTTAIGLALRQA